MPFELTDEQKDISKAVHNWAERKLEGDWDEDRLRELEEFPRPLFEEAIDLGYVGAWIPEEYGGAGLGVLDRCVITEAGCSVDPIFGYVTEPIFGTESIYLYGTEEQKEKFLPKVFEDYSMFSCLFTEASGGTDVASATTKAEKEGNEWVINGEKQYGTLAHEGDCSIILCRTTPKDEVEKRHHGLTQLLVENPADRDGWDADVIEKMGGHWLPTYTVGITDVETPEKNVIGEAGKGFYQSMEFFDFTRPWVAAASLGTAQCAFDLAVEYSKERDIFERKLSNFQAHQFRLAEMKNKIEAARFLTYRAAWLIDKGESKPLLSSCAKWTANEACSQVVKEARMIHGAYGYSKEYRIERIFRDAQLFEIVEGMTEAEKMAVSREILR